jgi:hypothetical protein
MISPVDVAAWIDRQLQRGVNKVAFELMHRGVPKSKIHYGLRLAMLLCIGSIAPMTLVTSPSRMVGVAIATLVAGMSTVLFFMHRSDYRYDVRAEERGLLTGRDIPRSAFWKLWSLAFFTHALATGIVPGVVLWTLDFLQNYIYGVPRTPPPREVRYTVPVEA